MKTRSFFLLLALILVIQAGCAAQVPGEEAAAAPLRSLSDPAKASPGSGTFFTIDEVGLGPDGYIALQNFTGQPASLAGLFLCQGPDCFELPGVEVPAGATVRIGVGAGSGLENVVASGASIGKLQPADGEIGLYTFRDASDPTSILAYLQWGSTPHQNTQAAIQAGLWIEGAFAPTSEKATRLYPNEGGLWLFDE